MLSILGSVLGFGVSFMPKVIGFFEAKRDQKHELLMMSKQLEQQMAIGAQRAEMVGIEMQGAEMVALHREHATITKKASQWCINLSSTVRPVITYCLFIEFATLTILVSFGAIERAEYLMIWNHEFQAVWAAVVSFWFGSRSFQQGR